MPTPTYTPIATQTLVSNTATITFNSLSNSYRDLILVMSYEMTASTSPIIRVNSDSASNYSTINILGSGSPISQTQQRTSFLCHSDNSSIDYPITHMSHFMDYSTTNKHKPVITRVARDQNWVELIAQNWASTSAINSITIQTAEQFKAGSTFTIYGVIS